MLSSTLFRSSIWALVLLVAVANCSVVINTTRLSFPRRFLTSIQAGDKVYFTGGFGFNDNVGTDVVDVFDLKTSQWHGTIHLNQSRGYITALAIEPNIYFVGGLDYTNRPFVYSEAIHDFVQPEKDPPTVRTPLQLFIHNNTLVVVGAFSVDFLDLSYLTWSYDAQLTALMARFSQSVVVAGNGNLFVMGGIDMQSGSISLSAYQYDFNSGNTTQHDNVIRGPISNSGALKSVEDNVMVLWDSHASQVVAYHTQFDSWTQLPCKDFVGSLSLPTQTLVFNTSGYSTIDWANDTTYFTPIDSESTDSAFILQHAFLLDGVPAYMSSEKRTFPSKGKVCIINPDKLSCREVLDLGIMLGDFKSLSRPYFHVLWNASHVLMVYNGTFAVETLLIPNTIYSVLPDPADENSVFIFYGASALLNVRADLVYQSAVFTPLATNMLADLVVGNDFIALNGKVGVGLNPVSPKNITAITQYTYNALIPDALAMMDAAPTIKPYRKMDIYNYDTNTWELDSVEIPEEVFIDNDYQVAAVLDNKIVLWFSNMASIYDPQFGSWTNFSFDDGLLVFSNRSPYGVHIPVLTVNEVAFLTDASLFYKFSLDNNGQWNRTAEAPSDTGLKMWQYMAYKDSQIYVSTDIGKLVQLFVDVYIYDIASGKWDTRQMPRQQFGVIMAQVGDFLAIFGDDGTVQSLHIPSTIWTVDEDFDNRVRFSTVLQTKYNNMTFVAGGISRGFFTDSDLVYILTDDGFIPDPPVAPVFSIDPASGPSGDLLITDPGIIAAIVVPIAAALIGAGLLAFFLVRRNKRRRGTSISMSGLETKYGTWFTPIDQLKFGQQLGQGANGQVFEGTWKSTQVALKVSMTQANAAVIAELELMIKLRPHPNVVQLLGFSIHPETDSIILIIEYCNQGSLDSILFDVRQAIAMDQKMDWLLGIAKGLGHLHANNIVHRDMAARNILVHQNEAKITDFGMSRLVGEQQHGTTKSELGPIRWMAPESLKDKQYSNKSDVWSFGILMYEVIAQSEPHLNADPIEIGRVIRDQGLTPVIPSSCPPELVSLMQQCWQFSPEQRPTIDQVIQKLDSSTTL